MFVNKLVITLHIFLHKLVHLRPNVDYTCSSRPLQSGYLIDIGGYEGRLTVEWNNEKFE